MITAYFVTFMRALEWGNVSHGLCGEKLMTYHAKLILAYFGCIYPKLLILIV